MTFISLHARTLMSVLLVVVSLYLWFRYRKDDRAGTGLVLALLGLTFFLRWYWMDDLEGNVDTSTWLASTLSVRHYPDSFWKLLNYTDSRPLTVFPLWAATWFGVDAGYRTAECVGVICWLGTLFFTYRALTLYVSNSLAVLLTWVLCLFIGTTWNNEHTAYNSEHFSIFLIAVATYAHLSFEKKGRTTALKAFGTGFLLGSLLFAKFQNVPMGLVVAGFMMTSLYRKKDFRSLAFLVSGGILPTIIVNIIFWSHGKLDEFWVNYVWHYILYSYTTEFQPLSVGERFNPIRAGRFLLSAVQSRAILSALLLVLTGGVAYAAFSAPQGSFVRTIRLFTLPLLAASMYAIVQAGNPFHHYALYIFHPLILATGAWLTAPRSRAVPLLGGALLLAAVGQGVWNLNTTPAPVISNYPPSEKQIIQTILDNSTEQDRLVVWGWVDRWHHYTVRPCGYRLAHTHLMYMKSDLYSRRMANFLEDMEANKPAIFVDAAIDRYSVIEGLEKPHDTFPEVKSYIDRHYQPLATIDSVRIYRRIR